jgi:1L-myo-inositol 1-phosphate cytidylyltransferase / CDP-L-myo-inositol myo-inositolphosphotransferase
MLPLFADSGFVDATHLASPVWVDDVEGGGSVLVGPAQLVAALVGDPTASGALPRRAAGPGTILNIATPAARRRATTVVLRATQKPTDGWVSRHFNRPVSRAFSRVALMLGMSATMASLSTLVVGLVCAWVAAQPGYLPLIVTGILFHLASVLDGVDGEIARATLTESAAGARVDTIVDQMTYLACFAGVTVGWVREGSGLMAAQSTALVGVALVASLIRAGRFVSRHAENASFVVIDRAVRRAARETGRIPLRVAAAAFTLLRRDLFALLFLGVSLTGLRGSIPALIFAGVVVANVTFSVYGAELADAARAERGLRGPAPAAA